MKSGEQIRMTSWLFFSASIELDMTNRLFLAMIAVLLDMILRDWPGFSRLAWHPVSILSRFLAWGERKLDRQNRSDTVRFTRGFVLLLFVLALAGGCGLVCEVALVHVPYGWLALPILLSHFLEAGGGLALAFRAGWRNEADTAPATGDVAGWRRRAIEAASRRQTEQSLTVLVLWVVFGLAGAFMAVALVCCDRQWSRRGVVGLFGLAVRRLGDMVQLGPGVAHVCALLMAAFLLGGRVGRGLLTAAKEAPFSRNLAFASLAGSLDLALGGPGSAAQHWIGNGRARITRNDARRAFVILALAWALASVGFSVLLLLVVL